MLSSKFLLWAAEAQSHWGTLGYSVEPASKVSQQRCKETGVVIQLIYHGYRASSSPLILRNFSLSCTPAKLALMHPSSPPKKSSGKRIWRCLQQVATTCSGECQGDVCHVPAVSATGCQDNEYPPTFPHPVLGILTHSRCRVLLWTPWARYILPSDK